ncbi:MAG: hypothetical protein JWN32_4099 [Solirubrobacterales bacterium]|jgi:hypothetical protein|nr:hypothetical protein [Solirubrobacterales bacterium]
MSVRRALLAALAVTAALVLSAPTAGASTLPAWSVPASLQGAPVGVNLPGLADAAVPTATCGTATNDGQGRTGGTATEVCMGSGLNFVGPAVGQIASVIGPTIIGPAVIGTSVQSAGNVAIGVGRVGP